jgi:hypothetical protein
MLAGNHNSILWMDRLKATRALGLLRFQVAMKTAGIALGFYPDATASRLCHALESAQRHSKVFTLTEYEFFTFYTRTN